MEDNGTVTIKRMTREEAMEFIGPGPGFQNFQVDGMVLLFRLGLLIKEEDEPEQPGWFHD